MPRGLEIDAERIKVARLVQQDRIAAIAGAWHQVDAMTLRQA